MTRGSCITGGQCGALLLKPSQCTTVSKFCTEAPAVDLPFTHQKLHDEKKQSPQLSQSSKSSTDTPRQSMQRNRTNRPGSIKQQRMKPHEIYQHSQNVLANMFTNKYYEKFFTTESSEGKNLSEVNVIKANRQLETTL